MANTINAVTTGTGGIATSGGDTSGDINIQSGGTTIVAVTSSGAAVTGTFSASGGITATAFSGTLPVANGGTGATTLTANNVLLGNGTSAVQVVAPGTSGNVLTSNGTTWSSTALPAGGVTSLNGQTGAITNTTAYAIGSYINGRTNDQATTYTVGSTYAGSSLYAMPPGSGYSTGAGGFTVPGKGTISPPNVGTGTWRCVSPGFYLNSDYGTNALFVRVS